MEFIWLFISYILGSIPFGYIVTKVFARKNILEIGWKKTSGSNVFKNVGVWQGVLSGLLDVAKGFVAVWGAQKLGLMPDIQVLAGILAVVGHNWSCFLKFAGGRGIGTLIGAFYALSSQILGISLIPLLGLAVIWNASIGTIVFLITAIVASCYYHQFEVVGYFILLSLIPIFIKRLSPVDDFKIKPLNKILLRNRLLFDADESQFNLRIKRIIKKLTKS